MRQAAQKFQLRPAPFVAAVPQPGMIRGQHRHPALAHPVEHQQRALARPGHHRLTAILDKLDQAQPAAPGRIALWQGRVFVFQPARHRVALSQLGDLGQVGRFHNLRRGTAGQDIGQRRAVERSGRGKFRPRRHQQRPAAFHIGTHVVEIEHGQDAAPLVSVEDHQVELVDALHEKLAGGKGDQAQLRHRHAIVAIGRAQDGEMHQIDARVGFQQVAPGALPRMRLARNQQDAQPVAHAVDLNHRAVVAVGDLARGLGQLELDHVHARMGQGQRQFQVLARGHHEAAWRLAVDGDAQFGPLGQVAGHRALVLDAQGHHEFFAQDREGRGVAHDQAAVPVAVAPSDQRMERRGQVGGELQVMDAPIGQQDRPGDAGPGGFGHQLRKRPHDQ